MLPSPAITEEDGKVVIGSCPFGVPIPYRQNGALIGKGKIDGDLNVMGSSYNTIDLQVEVSGEAYFNGLTAMDATFHNSRFQRNFDLHGAHLNKINLRGVHVDGILCLDDVVIKSCQGAASLVLGQGYTSNEGTKLPSSLKRALRKYERIETPKYATIH